ncbi:MAG: alpha/beta fold hydrolase [Pseudomonadota bacterium]
MQTDYFTTPAGHRLALSVFGPADGRPVLFFHGGGQTRHAWGRAGEALGKRGWRALCVDMRGHGDSDRVANYHATDFADDVRALAESQRQKPVIVGASLGGIAAMIANAGHGAAPGTPVEISRALVLVDIAPRVNPEGVNRILDFMAAHTAGFASLDEAAAAVAAYQPQRTQRSDNSGLRKNLRQADDGRWYWHWDPDMLAQFRRTRDETSDEDALYRAAEGLTQPVLLVRGAQSDVVSEDITREFQARIPQARVADVSGAGHMVAGDRNDVFLDAVLAFLDEL